MATTTNYGWDTPDDTDLVKDGAAAIRTLGSSIDTTTKNLNPSTTLGDIEYRSATANTNTRLAIGSTGNVLTVTGGVPVWAAPATGGGMTLLSTTTLSGTSTTISGISTAYKNLQIVVQLVSLSNAGTYNIQPNASATNCVFVGQYFFGPSTTGVSSSAGGAPAPSSNFLTSNTDNSFSMNIYDYASASNRKSFDFQGYYFNASNVYCAEQAHGGVKTTSAITSLKLEASLGYSFNSGTVLLYGVS